MNNNTLMLAAASTLAARQPKRLPSEKQAEVTANLSLISRTWRTLTDQQRQDWTALGQVWSPNPKKATASGFAVFQSLNGVRLNSGQGDILPDAPAQPAFIGKFPPFVVGATVVTPPASLSLTSADTPAASTFSLYFDTSSFHSPFLVLATRPLSAGTTRPDPKQFRQIAFYPTLASLPVDLSDAYAAQFSPPAPGMKVAVQIVPVTPGGFRGNPITRIATVTAGTP